jgi:hypothetical protein
MRHPFIAGMLMAEETGITAKIVGLFLTSEVANERRNP